MPSPTPGTDKPCPPVLREQPDLRNDNYFSLWSGKNPNHTIPKVREHGALTRLRVTRPWPLLWIPSHGVKPYPRYAALARRLREEGRDHWTTPRGGPWVP